MAYTLTQMIDFFRVDMNDQYEPYLWSDDEIKRYLAEAQDLFMERTKYKADTEVISYLAGASTTTLPTYIIQIRNAYDSSEQELDVIDRQDWVNYKAGASWRADTGVVDTLITDLTSDTIRLYPIPETSGSFSLDVFRVAKKELDTYGIFEVTENQAQRIILLGAKAYAYGKQDVDVYDPKAELKYHSLFEAKITDYYSRIQNRRRYSRPVSYGGI